jgi:fucose 4-O-acetylase-like acetyltransferase
MATLDGHITDLNAYPYWTYFGAFFFGFRMPLFFIISGLLVGRSLTKKGLPTILVTEPTIYYSLYWYGGR